MLPAVEYALLALAVALVLRILAMPPLRKDAAAFPALACAVGAAMLVAGIVVAWASLRWPAARHAAAAVVLAAMIATWWRARPGYGASRRWPPGSLGLRASIAAIDDRSFYRDQAARHGPVFKMSQFGRPVACVIGHERAHRILVDHADALMPAALPYNRLLAKGVLRYMSGADHKQEAPVFRAMFAKMELAGAEGSLRSSLRRELDAFAAESSRSPGGGYARAAFERWIVGAIVRVFYGLSPDDPRVDRIGRLLPLIAHHRGGGARWRRDMIAGVAGIAAIVREVEREGRTGSPVVAAGSALRLLVAADANALDTPARVENLVMVEKLASSDLTGLLDWIFWFLGGASDWVDAVRAHGRTAGGPASALPLDPATAIVMETLRLEQSEFLYRRTTKPAEIDGRVIPAGWILRLCVNESHRDARVFANPDRFDPSRFVDRTWTRYEYSPFGGHTHGCMGIQLSTFLGRLFVEELAIGYDWSVVADGTIQRGSRHRDHWRPSAERRAVMRRRANVAEAGTRIAALAADR